MLTLQSMQLNSLLHFSIKGSERAYIFLGKKKSDLNTTKKTLMGSRRVTKALVFAIIGTLSDHVSKTNASEWKQLKY